MNEIKFETIEEEFNPILSYVQARRVGVFLCNSAEILGHFSGHIHSDDCVITIADDGKFFVTVGRLVECYKTIHEFQAFYNISLR